ncbi:DUF1127 domain-containing protein [Rhodopila globiformis]|uniref:YjiS-like domain-containing protein n=1 Tax=Rhodopila globiformis TaxID=1071 RepID=A0A2S6N4J2_RHOGL|nr:DUF1127 domain-containing protein [Rhodopila globiformis]PPQ29532.1 hypothetical protein CCS01_21295 [Rhodopila globiformis]
MNLTHTIRLPGRGPHPTKAARHIPLPAGFARVAAAWSRRRRLVQDRRTLEGFSDRLLGDIGLSRCDIPAALVGTVRRD